MWQTVPVPAGRLDACGQGAAREAMQVAAPGGWRTLTNRDELTR